MFRPLIIITLLAISAVVAEVPWKDQIRTKLYSQFIDRDEDSLARIFFYLDEEDRLYKWNGVGSANAEPPPAWKTLKSALKYDGLFKKYAQRMADDTKRAEMDEAFRKTMSDIYGDMMDATDHPYTGGQDFDPGSINSQTEGSTGLARALSLMSLSRPDEIRSFVKKIVGEVNYEKIVQDVTEQVNKRGRMVVLRDLTVIYLSYEAVQNLRRWWKGEISGRRCAKSIVDTTFTVGAGVCGGVGGAALGSSFGPYGIFIGGLVGGYISSQAAELLSDRLTQSLFGIPKHESLEKAYSFFGVDMTASNIEINESFRKLSLKHHPGNGGKREDYILVQSNLAVIKMARGEHF